jgi:hypothetical protein
MHDFRDEYEQFPLGTSDHLLDALAQGPEFWQKGNSRKEIQLQEKAMAELMDQRDAMTGY